MNFFKLLVENREWLFSGIGGSCLVVVYKFLFKNRNLSDVGNTPKAEKPDPIATRLREAVKQLRYCHYQTRRLATADIAEQMGYSSPRAFSKKLSGENAIGFDEMERLSCLYGVNPDWLRTGQGEMFSIAINTDFSWYPYESSHIVEAIKEMNPARVFLLRDHSSQGDVRIILQLTAFKYVTLPVYWNTGGKDTVGGEGRRQLVELHQLIRALDASNLEIEGRTISKHNLRYLTEGKGHPTEYLSKSTQSFWWDDLTDLNHIHPISSSYETLYGHGFIETQSMIKWGLLKRGLAS